MSGPPMSDSYGNDYAGMHGPAAQDDASYYDHGAVAAAAMYGGGSADYGMGPDGGYGFVGSNGAGPMGPSG